ncbi:hypothetical protein RFI_06032 [Reticulomyxa filosa]|uniref:Uncharacterized protein n=1 Tax=Reticulomyxa filosa TaxID=46433 RepID=X6P0M7_RETFI|nr:hypothetical protein RFI_06032 [Reticulomyxa filosa]|eukprot:ETO31087.1 hypothetical protein RFI_06032 [Reticulomyxa filosa]
MVWYMFVRLFFFDIIDVVCFLINSLNPSAKKNCIRPAPSSKQITISGLKLLRVAKKMKGFVSFIFILFYFFLQSLYLSIGMLPSTKIFLAPPHTKEQIDNIGIRAFSSIANVLLFVFYIFCCDSEYLGGKKIMEKEGKNGK